MAFAGKSMVFAPSLLFFAAQILPKSSIFSPRWLASPSLGSAARNLWRQSPWHLGLGRLGISPSSRWFFFQWKRMRRMFFWMFFWMFFLGILNFYFWIFSRAHQLEAAQAALQAKQSGRTFLVPHGSLLWKQNIAKGHSNVYRGFAAPACGRSVVLQPLPWMAVGNVLLSTCTLPFKRTLEVHQILHLPWQNGTGGSPNPPSAMKNGTKGSPNSAHAAKNGARGLPNTAPATKSNSLKRRGLTMSQLQWVLWFPGTAASAKIEVLPTRKHTSQRWNPTLCSFFVADVGQQEWKS